MSKKVSNTLYGLKQLFIDGQLRNIDNMSVDELVINFKTVHVLCFTDEFFDNEYFDNLTIFESILSEKKLEAYYKNVCLIKCPFKILNNEILKNSISIVSLEIINELEHKPDDQYNEHTLIVPIFTISKSDVKLYLSQFKNCLLEDYFKIKFLNYYFGSVKKIKDISYMIENCDEANYWSNYYNCKLNISIQFMNRNFNFIDVTKIENKKLLETIEGIKNLPEDGGDYLSYMYRKQNFVDASNAVKKEGYNIYKVVDKKELPNFVEIIQKLSQEKSHEELIILITNMLVSKEYCHLILNNQKMLELLLKISPNILEINFKKMISYGWISLYLEETIKKSYIDINDRFVFTCTTASKLPTFQFSYNKLKDSPYLPILINDKLYMEFNAYGVDHYTLTNYESINIDKELIKQTYGVADLQTFKARFNVFLAGHSKKHYDAFKNVNFNNIAISGSVIAACLPRFNPLIINTGGNFEAFIDEYYGSADLDIMCNLKDTFEYIDKAYELNEQLDKNTKSISNENISRIEPVKNAVMFINFKKLDEFIKDLKIDCTKETFKDHLLENKKKIYQLYIDYKVNEHRKHFDENPEKFQDPKYNVLFDILPMDQINIYIKDFYELDDNMEQNKILIYENIKFKYKITGIKRNFEFFQIKYENFFSTVHKFHLPCVRAYYDGTDVFMLPSCIGACMTLTNIEYKYFAGSKDPIEVINKYRQRGFTTILNDKERIKMIKYSFDVEKWKDLYEIHGLNKRDTDRIFKPLDINCRLFKTAKMYEKMNLFFSKTNCMMYNNVLTINENGYIIPLDRKILTLNPIKNDIP